jgi:hypothetical protein
MFSKRVDKGLKLGIILSSVEAEIGSVNNVLSCGNKNMIYFCFDNMALKLFLITVLR